MKPCLIVTHLEDRCSGLVAGALADAGVPIASAHAVDRDPLPPVGDLSGIVALGGNDSATRASGDPFLSAEVSLLRDALDRELPVLGICLGAQLLAVAAGGTVTAGAMYAGWPALTLAGAAADDPLFGGLPDGLPVLQWHEDRIEPLPAARVLADTVDPGVTAFALGERAWGSQMHLELTPELLVDTWLAEPGATPQIEGAGHRIEHFRAESRRRLVAQMAAARPLFARFAAIVGEAG
jgi:GMP synthase-like glutamine amidotransferase